MNNHRKVLKEPKRMLRKDVNSDKEYFKAFSIYKSERRRWINQNKSKSKEAILSKIKLKEKKDKKKYNDKLNRSKNGNKYVQKRIF